MGKCASDPETPEIPYGGSVAPGHRASRLVGNELCESGVVKDRFSQYR